MTATPRARVSIEPPGTVEDLVSSCRVSRRADGGGGHKGATETLGSWTRMERTRGRGDAGTRVAGTKGEGACGAGPHDAMGFAGAH
ncbi:unnamed protein product [Lampetra fluviatilis]